MQCYFCDTVLEPIGNMLSPEIDGKVTVAYRCPNCKKWYQAQLATIAVFAHPPGQEDILMLLRHCWQCGRLYRDGATHECPASGET